MEIERIPYTKPLTIPTDPEAVYARLNDAEPSDLKRNYNNTIRKLGDIVVAAQKIAYFIGENQDEYGPLPETAFYAGRAALNGADAELSKFKSSHDPLTGALNREGFLQALQDDLLEVSESGDKNLGVLVLMSDTDKFKSVNDTHGHEAGDEVLRHIASALAIESSVRVNREDEKNNDAVAREGGDEFKVSMIIPIDQAEKIVSRIRERLDEITVIYKNGRETLLQVGLSIGAVLIHGATIDPNYTIPETNRRGVHPDEIKRIYMTADSAMYEEKQRRHPPTIATRILKLFKLQKMR